MVEQQDTPSLFQDTLYHPPLGSTPMSPSGTWPFIPSPMAMAQKSLPHGRINDHLHMSKPPLLSSPTTQLPCLQSLTVENAIHSQNALPGDGGMLSQSSVENTKHCETSVASLCQCLHGAEFKKNATISISDEPSPIPPLFKCKKDGCSRSFGWKSSMRRHLKSHLNQRPHACEFPLCDRTYKRKDHLHRHYKHIHGHAGNL